MPRNLNIKKVLVIGSGPIVIGQAAEFDYAGTQACRVLRDEGVEIVLVNSNPATIMTDSHIADRIYIEPLTPVTLKRIIEKETPDSVLSGLGGQTGLTLCMQLSRDGFWEQMGVRLLGSPIDAIEKAEDRELFKETMEAIGQPVIPSDIATDLERAAAIADEIGYPVIVRPAYTLGGSGGGIAETEAEFRAIARNGIEMSPIHQILVEKSVAGWKEIEFEVMRDGMDNAITVCSMENFDPVGVHTGDSIVIAPAVTLADKEYQMLRSAALAIIRALGVEGGCNCQFALNPDSFEYAVIEVNPRVSRSSALASKATGYPIAKVATKIALGYTLDEIPNAVTGSTFAAFEPALDYVAVKFPKWPFDKFVYAKRDLGTQMKATGEVMAISDTFESALMKAIRGAEISSESRKQRAEITNTQLLSEISKATDDRIFKVFDALRRGITPQEIFDATKIDKWFLYKLLPLCKGTSDNSALLSVKSPLIYKMVDTCAGEFAATTPYFYSIEGNGENEALEFIAKSVKERVLVLGSGPIRIGQGIEFDYACVHCVWSLKELGYEVIVINNNPETVSTDFDTADRLYFEPLHIDDVMSVIEIEKPIGVIVAFGGGTAIKLTQELNRRGVKILGTSADSIDVCEDRDRFDKLLEDLDVKRPAGFGVFTEVEALTAAGTLGYPVLMRPSYVLGGQNMIIAYGDDDIKEYMEVILRQKQENPVLIDKYLSGREIEVDALCDGTDILIPGIMEHIERTGIHSGDSIAVYPATHIEDDLAERIFEETKKLCAALDVRGLVNIQYVITDGEIFVIEVNPRASRTVPYISKVTGVQMCDAATRLSLGQTLAECGLKPGFAKIPPYTAVKVPVFSFEKLTDVDTQLGPEMKSTGEVLGVGKNLQEALYKGLAAAGYKMRKGGGVFITVRDQDKSEIADIAKKFVNIGLKLYATAGTAKILWIAGMEVEVVNKISENSVVNSRTLLESGEISYIISTSTNGRDPALDSVQIRRKATVLGIPCLTSLDTAAALADSMLSRYGEHNTELVDINRMRPEHIQLPFTKMQGCGNDYIYIDCFKYDLEALGISSPESLSVFLSDRRFGVGGDGVILIMPSEIADAKMRMFNLDGSEGKMCGNGIRCVAKYLYDNGIIKTREMKIETLSGIKELYANTQNGEVSSVRVNMGKATVTSEISVEGNTRRSVGEPVYIDVGNPHRVVFVDSVDTADVEGIGNMYPDYNNEFTKVVDSKRLQMRVWERGSGETLACGTGACAAVAAAVLKGYCEKDTDVKVQLLGGDLTVQVTDETVYLTGECKTVYNGVVRI
ncbi:MAG: carbamoyl-phosphate synthase large subunit [Oscillospiraceae bacterium]|jgi:carbamoyl-phosphate synthase large subunit|nr:carbamoyl-phosphate synthase large subunit [Oscillospiraceae bacterium]